ncbi:hypothetical protein NC653_016511 [Populus alba x Populus x berolinensis]|uniref:Uncharacterized protein n=1 Tax=Populus alba x Populus x berolinensis TaxID=444605 RepID=A0AAD6QN89_9ROSI|nr:hypothetical protein NC653_016511 [Populus alba x Populus x berolinensis]
MYRGRQKQSKGLLLLYRELLQVLLDVKQIVDLFLSFVESFSWLDREFDKPMIFFRVSEYG